MSNKGPELPAVVRFRDHYLSGLALLLQHGNQFAEQKLARRGRFGKAHHQKLRYNRISAFTSVRRLGGVPVLLPFPDLFSDRFHVRTYAELLEDLAGGGQVVYRP